MKETEGWAVEKISMSCTEVEVDPLEAQDPLDCTKENVNIENHLENWVSFEADFRMECKEIEPGIVPETGPRLRARKPSKINLADLEDDSDGEWKSKRERRRKKKQIWMKQRKKIGTDSDEENTIPCGRAKLRRKGKYFSNLKDSNNEFACNVCQETFDTELLLNEHVTNSCHSFSCKNCSEVFTDSNSLKEHLSSVHVKCFDAAQTSAGSSGHNVSSVQNEKNGRCKKYYEQLKNERKYQCDICHKTFITSGHLNTHMYRHSGKKWICDGCGKNFSCERSLIRHKDTFPGEHRFPCEHCDVIFFRKLNLAKHMEIKHPEATLDGITNRDLRSQSELSERDFSCKKCCKIFPSHEMLLIHKKVMHAPEEEAEMNEEQEEGAENEEGVVIVPKYKCEVCFKEFVSLEGFEYHKAHQHVEKDTKKKKKKGKPDIEGDDTEEETNERPRPSFVCRICSTTFTLKSALQTHLKSHNVTKNVEVRSGSHQCCICPRSFTSSDGLKYHLATHTGERRYSCGQCGKRFIKKTHLSEHIATHSEVKYFKCPRCPRTFSTHSAYRKHIKHFPGPHSFPCKKCGKLFTKESMIEKHMCVDLVKITMAPEVKALLSEDMIEEYLCLAEEQMAQELSVESEDKQTSQNISHSCYKCFKIFPSLSSLQAHQNDHIGKQNYQCRFCPENFKRADAFGAHIRNHLGSTPYMCLKCNRKFISPFTLSMHAKNYPGDHSFTCQKCQRWFPSEKRLEKHECILQNSDYFKCACGSTFASWNELLQHAGTKPYRCCSCELKYPTLMALARHIKKHTGAKPFECEMCGKSFRAKNNYLNHKNTHKNAKEIQCEHCAYKSKSQKRMDFHLFRKHDIGSNMAKSTLCPICGVIFPYTSQMKKHVELEHGSELVSDEGSGEKKSLPPELCTLCGKMLNNKYTLANHMKKVHGPNASKKDRKIKCEFCEEKFHTLKKLQRHAEVHETPGLRTCELCQKEFYFAKELRKHMRKHDTNKPFSCSRCGKHFKVSVSLKYHSTICGNVSNRTSNNRKKKEVKEAALDVLYGHINPIDLNSQPYVLQIYGR